MSDSSRPSVSSCSPLARGGAVFVLLVACISSFLTISAGEPATIDLTQEERDWLAKHPELRLAPDPDFPPFEFFDESGAYRGIAADYVSILEKKLGIKITIVRCATWTQAVDKAKKREVDLWAAATKSPERSEYMLFTKPHISLPGIILTRTQTSGNLKLADLAGKRVAVVAGYVWEEFIRKDHPAIHLAEVPDTLIGLRKLSFGEVDAMVCGQADALWYIEKDGISNLHVAGNTGYQYALAMAVRKDWPELAVILDKGLAAISDEERQTVTRKWIALKPDSILESPTFWIVLLSCLGAVAIVAIGIVVWNRSLRGQVDQRTREIKDELAKRKQAEEELARHRDQLEATVEERTVELSKEKERFEMAMSAASDGLWDWDVSSGKVFHSPRYMSMLGYAADELPHTLETFEKLVHPEDKERVDEITRAHLEEGPDSYEFEVRLLTKEGDYRWILSRGRVVKRGKGNEPLRAVGTHVDITERKRVEEKLRASEAQNRTLVTNLPGAVYRCALDSDWTMAYVSDGIEDICGFPASDFIGNRVRTFASVIHPEDAAHVEKVVLEGVDKKEAYALEYRVQHADESMRWVAEAGRASYDEDGKAIWLDGVIFDITDRKQAREALRESEERLKTIMRTTRQGFWLVDNEGRTLDVNPAMRWILGRPSEKILGKTICEFTDEENTRVIEEQMDCRDEGQSSSYEITLSRPDGVRVPCVINATPLLDKEGKKTGSFAMVTDITYRRKAEEQLRKLSGAVEQSPATVVITDTAGCIEYVNPKFEELTGYTSEEAVGLNPRVLKSGRHPPEYYEDLWKTITSGKVWRGEFCNKKKSGELYWELASISPVRNPKGEITHFLAVKEDVTDRKEAEEELLRAREVADSANRAKSEFLSNMSHELRTPLNGVLGYAQILQRDPTLTREHQDCLSAIENCGEHLLTLINDVLDLSKIEAGRMEVESAPCDLPKLVKSVHDIVLQRAEQKGLKLILDVSPEVPKGIETDATKLRQILVNLLGNAVKFTSEGNVTLSLIEAEKGWLTFSVTDTGMGIPEDKLEAIFDPFKQDEGGKSEGGTGLGLAISQRLVEALGGRMKVESKLNEGSCFSFTHPINEVDLPAEPVVDRQTMIFKRDPKLAPGQDIAVLIADDRKANRDILVRFLKAAGFKTHEAVHGRQAVDKLRRNRHPIVFMDIRMPVMNGIEAIREIRADSDLKETVVIAVSASVFPDAEKRFAEEGFNAFIGKPLRADQVFSRIKEHLDVKFLEDEADASAERGAVTDADATLAPDVARELAGKLKNAAEVGDVMELAAIAEELKESAAPASPYAEKVGSLADAFDFEGVLALAEKLEKESEQ